MKKLIPALLIGTFAITTGFANTPPDKQTTMVTKFNNNTIVTEAEFSNTELLLNRWQPLNNVSVLDVQVQDSENIYKFVSIPDILSVLFQNHLLGLDIKWDSEANSLEITDTRFLSKNLIPETNEEEQLISDTLQLTEEELTRQSLERAMIWASHGIFSEEMVIEMLEVAREAKK